MYVLLIRIHGVNLLQSEEVPLQSHRLFPNCGQLAVLAVPIKSISLPAMRMV